MASYHLKRRLSAILSADVKGYSRLMGDDEEWTVRTVKAYKEVIRDLVGQHEGRVVDALGDNVLAEFSSVVDAVQCAVETQQVLRTKNALLPENRRMEFRIGINLGDVIEEGDAIYGDGVNIAARMESLAQPGGICLSGSAYEQIENKLPLRYEFLGEQEVKNIAKPIRVYRAQIEPEASPSTAGVAEKKPVWKRMPKTALGIMAIFVLVGAAAFYHFVLRSPPSETQVASTKKMAFPLPDAPSIAVLPFVNMSDDPKQEYLADGFAEELINGLSKCPHIVVIARKSTFVYKGKPVKVQKIAEDLGVRYVIEGSLRKTGDQVHITVQLVDALTGLHLFSERYVRELADILVMQDEITIRILETVQVKLTAGEDARLRAKGTKNLEAYLALMQARQQMQIYNKEHAALARQLSERAIALDPRYAAAYVTLCRVQVMEVLTGAYKNPREAFENADRLGEKALALDGSDSFAHATMSYIHNWLRDYDTAISEAEKAIRLEPNSAYAYFTLASALNYAGQPREAIPFFEKSLRLSPIPIDTAALTNLGNAYRQLGQYEEAIGQYKKALRLYGPDHVLAHLYMAGTYALMGREKEARAEVAEVVRIDPAFSAESFGRALPYKNRKMMVDDFLLALHKAGLA
jgi:adenylate cyclase